MARYLVGMLLAGLLSGCVPIVSVQLRRIRARLRACQAAQAAIAATCRPGGLKANQ